MSLKLYVKFIDSLRKEHIEVEKLSLKQISKSLELYRLLGE